MSVACLSRVRVRARVKTALVVTCACGRESLCLILESVHRNLFTNLMKTMGAVSLQEDARERYWDNHQEENVSTQECINLLDTVSPHINDTRELVPFPRNGYKQASRRLEKIQSCRGSNARAKAPSSTVDKAFSEIIAAARRIHKKTWESAPFQVRIRFIEAGRTKALRYNHARDAAERAYMLASLVREGKIEVELQKRNFKKNRFYTISTLRKTDDKIWIRRPIQVWCDKYNVNIKASILSEVLR